MRLFDRMRQQKVLSISLLLATLTIGILIGTLINTGVNAARGAQVAPDATPLVIPAAVELSTEFTKLAKRLGPSVVNITADYTPRTASRERKAQPQGGDEEGQGNRGDSGDGMDLFRKFFHGNPMGDGDADPRMFRREQSGSGFIVDKNGYIITNNHVVDKVDKIKVRLHGDDTDYPAKLIGYDRETDLAVIKIDPRRALTPVTIGNSDGLQVGDWAVAIGSPFGLEASVTAGIVSATGRYIPGAQQFQRFIQTDAAINPGNSGGPLADIRGDVIGVNTMIATQTGGYQGIGFALPINIAVRVYNDIIRTGRVARGSLGIGWNKATDKPELFEALGTNHGVLVSEVTPGGPADKAGIKPDDIIVSLNSRAVQDGDDLVNRVADLPIGSEASVSVDRGGKKMDFQVAILDRAQVFKDDPRFAPDQPEEQAAPAKSEPAPQARFGMKIRELADADRQGEGIKDKQGVVVTGIEPDSFADDLGIQERDVIVSINRQPVKSADDVRRIQATLKAGEPVALHVYRATRTGQNVLQWTSVFLAGKMPAN